MHGRVSSRLLFEAHRAPGYLHFKAVSSLTLHVFPITRLPWDPDWIIESLSDSVIYMGYYTLARHINRLKLKPEQLSDTVLDYLLLGQGDPDRLAISAAIDSSKLKEIRDEFAYFYPVDSRHSGRDLIPNHLTFYIFNHAAIFPEENWPCQIVTNGSVLMEHAKMSKSYGNIIPLRDAISRHGADTVRLSSPVETKRNGS